MEQARGTEAATAVDGTVPTPAGMTFTQKLARLAEGVNKAQAAKAAGLPANAIRNRVANGSIPRADLALKLARAFHVPLEWLVDNQQGWPPPGGDPALPAAFEIRLAELTRRVERLEVRSKGGRSAVEPDDPAELKRLARTAANVAQIAPDNRRICPFCGTGSRNARSLLAHLLRSHEAQLMESGPAT